jgi:hypothetical protein
MNIIIRFPDTELDDEQIQVVVNKITAMLYQEIPELVTDDSNMNLPIEVFIRRTERQT